jgi:uncharacterized protein YndB with AHSA1/START domain
MSSARGTSLELRLERRIRAPRQRVWDAWTKPELVRRWSAPEGMSVPAGTMDVRVGGSWEVTMVRDDNGERHVAFGRYLEIVPPQRIMYTHAWRSADGGSSPETTLTVELIEDGDATRVILTQEGFGDAGSRDGHAEGWGSALNKLVAVMEG